MNTTQKQPPKKKPAAKKKTVKRRKINAKNMATIIVSIIVVLGLIGGSAGMVVLGSMLKDAPKIDINNFESKESTQILDKDGNLIQDIGQQIRTNVSYDDMPSSLIDAFVAVEDSRYFEHNGFDLLYQGFFDEFENAELFAGRFDLYDAAGQKYILYQ